MAARKGYTRKQLKQPDEFIAFSQRAWTFARENRIAVIVGSAVTLLVVAGSSFWVSYSEDKAAAATLALTEGIERYNRIVLEAPAEPSDNNSSNDKGTNSPEGEGDKADADAPYATNQERLAAAEKSFSETVDEYGKSGVGEISVLLRAGVRFDQGKYDDAISDYQLFLDQSDHPGLRRMAAAGLAYSYEASERWEEAKSAFRKLGQLEGKDDQGDQLVNYHVARLLAKQGKADEAIEQLRKIADDAKSIQLQEKANQQLAVLEE